MNFEDANRCNECGDIITEDRELCSECAVDIARRSRCDDIPGGYTMKPCESCPSGPQQCGNQEACYGELPV